LYDSILLVGYWVTEFSGTLIAGDDASDAGYFPPGSLPEIAFESHLKFIRGLQPLLVEAVLHG
jgi:hypothetical protein